MTTLKAFFGSCYCGKVQYRLKLKFPPDMSSTQSGKTIRIYKCNCTTCQKMGFFHCRPINPSQDFILTSPAAISELGEYRVYSKKHGWYFCKECGVRVVGTGGVWEQANIDVDKWAGVEKKSEHEKLQRVWKTKGNDVTAIVDGVEASKPYYLSINATTLDQGDEVDLAKWHEQGWIYYVENLRQDKKGLQMQLGKPYEGGMY